MGDYYYARDGQQQGPVSLAELKRMASAGHLWRSDLVWTEGMADWLPAETIPGLFDVEAQVAGPTAYAPGPILSYQNQETYVPAGLQPVSFTKYILLFAIGIAMGLIFFLGVNEEAIETMPVFWTVWLFATILIWIYWIVYSLIILYRAWRLIPPSQARTKPGLAVGFLFIPLFNLYWFFVAFWGLATDYNKTVKQTDPSAPVLSVNIALLLCITSVLCVIPVLGIFSSFAATVFMVIFDYQLCQAINYACGKMETKR